jgi:PHP family Zn ribbon phosphoesterase
MKIIADLHIHSRFSRACSPQLTLPNLEKWAQIKGINLLTVADFTHPVWIKECEEQLESENNGFYKLKGSKSNVHFIFTTELSFIYKKNDKVRRVHEVVLAPSLGVAKKFNQTLEKRNFNLRSDGRPILGLSDRDFVELAKGVDKEIEVIPAHIWTPWFSVFGSKSGYDKLEDCFGDMTKYIFALETGLSSDPPMNWRVSALDPYILISNSDSHSLKNIGREANVFEIPEKDFSYQELIRILKEKDTKKFLYTIEFFPEEGKYHFDGHRDCKIVFSPEETIKHKNICPVCQRPLTMGVSYRVEQLADRKKGYIPQDKPGYKRLIELDKIIAQVLGVKNRESRAVMDIYFQMIKDCGGELSILIDQPLKDLQSKNIDEKIIEGIKNVREEKLFINPGYDGVYGEIGIFTEPELKKETIKKKKVLPGQKNLF